MIKNQSKKRVLNREKAAGIIILIACICFYGCFYAMRSSITPITNAFEDDFGLNANQISSLQSYFFFSYMVLQLVAGIVIQYVSCELVLIISTFISGIAILLFSNAKNYGTLVISRVLLGLFCSPVWVSVLKVIQQNFDISNVSFYAGIALLFGNLSYFGISILQAYLYQKYKIWRIVYLIAGIIMFGNSIIITICYLIDRKIISNNMDISLARKWFITRDNIVDDDESSLSNDEERVLRDDGFKLSKLLLVLKSPYNFVLSTLHTCSCIPQAILAGLWYNKYLLLKFKWLERTDAQYICGINYIGSGIGAVLFGFICRRYQNKCTIINHILIITGFLLSYVIFIPIYLNQRHIGYATLMVTSFISGFSIAPIPVIFLLIRKVNIKEKIEDLASGFASMICMFGVAMSYIATSEILTSYKSTENNGSNNNNYSVEQFNYSFTLIGINNFVGLLCVLLLPTKL